MVGQHFCNSWKINLLLAIKNGLQCVVTVNLFLISRVLQNDIEIMKTLAESQRVDILEVEDKKMVLIDPPKLPTLYRFPKYIR